MEFWGVEIKAGKPLKVQLEDDKIIHISHASIGESKKGADSVQIFVKVDENKLVLGHLSTEKFPQISFDLVFEKDFELSHNWTGGSVYFTGYKSIVADEDEYSDMASDSEEDELLMSPEENGKAAAPKKLEVSAKPKSSVIPKAAEAVKVDEDEDEDDDDDDEDLSDLGDSELDSSEEEDDDDEDSEEEDEETPKKVETGKKRANGSASKTPDAKKVKLATPQTDGKKNGVKVATPHPAKQGAKTPPTGNKKQQQSPKSVGSKTCNSCSKNFNSDAALQSHSKAKHGAK